QGIGLLEEVLSRLAVVRVKPSGVSAVGYSPDGARKIRNDLVCRLRIARGMVMRLEQPHEFCGRVAGHCLMEFHRERAVRDLERLYFLNRSSGFPRHLERTVHSERIVCGELVSSLLE